MLLLLLMMMVATMTAAAATTTRRTKIMIIIRHTNIHLETYTDTQRCRHTDSHTHAHKHTRTCSLTHKHTLSFTPTHIDIPYTSRQPKSDKRSTHVRAQSSTSPLLPRTCTHTLKHKRNYLYMHRHARGGCIYARTLIHVNKHVSARLRTP